MITRHKEMALMNLLDASPYRIAVRANAHKRQPVTPSVICLPDATADVLRRLDILGRKLTQEGAYTRAWAALDAIIAIEQMQEVLR